MFLDYADLSRGLLNFLLVQLCLLPGKGLNPARTSRHILLNRDFKSSNVAGIFQVNPATKLFAKVARPLSFPPSFSRLQRQSPQRKLH